MPITDPRLQLNAYTPNWKDKRVRAKVRYVIDFIEPMYRTQAETEVMSKSIRKVFGNHHDKNTLAQWLYANLLRQKLWYSQGLHPYSYEVKSEGFVRVLKLLIEAETQARKRDRPRTVKQQ